MLQRDGCAGYGGALSVYAGLSAALQLLSVSFVSIALHNNAFANCGVSGDVDGGNNFGGGVSLYIGAYSSVFSSNGDAVAAVGDTVVRNVSVTLDSTTFESCSATRNGVTTFGANVYGGSFSFYVGAYAWSRSDSRGNSSSTCGATDVSGVTVRVLNASSVHSSASTTTIGGNSRAANSYGGSMSVLYVGAYAWSRSNAASSNSRSMCEATTASGVSVHVSDSGCSNCSALSTSGFSSFGANSYGGAIGASYIGSLSYSFAAGEFRFSSSSVIESTRVHRLSVTITNCTIADTQAMSGECRGSHPIQL